MKFVKHLAAAALLALSAVPASAGGVVNVGTLTCQVDGGIGYIIGSSRTMSCAYHPVDGEDEFYVGRISRIGLDFGFTNGQIIVWGVFAPGHVEKGALSGNYIGLSAEATLGAGIGANALVGGMERAVQLQPLSIQAQTGLNAALAGASVNLEEVN